MNIQQIEYIIALNELKSFGKAAERCFITQSTLSTMVARFEDEMEIVLFDRKTKPITVTKEGEKVIQQLKIIAKELENLREVVDTLKGKSSGKVKIGVIPTVAPYLLPLIIDALIQTFPNVQFEINEIITTNIVKQLERRELDIGIVSLPLNHPELIEIPLYEEPFLIFDAAKTEWKQAFKLTEIDVNRLWLLQEGHCMRTQVASICSLDQQVNKQLEYRSGTLSTLMKIVQMHKGITLLPYLATIDFSEKERLHLKKLDQPEPARSVGLLVHKHFVKKRLLDTLKKDIQAKVLPLLQDAQQSYRLIEPI
ncbi:MAG: LysR substrate-binding domain-containing protein [Bacteroidota bacterium]